MIFNRLIKIGFVTVPLLFIQYLDVHAQSVDGLSDDVCEEGTTCDTDQAMSQCEAEYPGKNGECAGACQNLREECNESCGFPAQSSCVAESEAGEYSTVSGGKGNIASGKGATIIGGLDNTASGKYSIAMGKNANAKKDRSLVINLGKERVSSKNKGQFLVNSDSFTFQIGNEKATIDNKNILNFKNLLEFSDDDSLRHRHLKNNIMNTKQQEQIDEQQEQIIEQQQQINNQQEINNELHEKNSKQQEQINELYKQNKELHRMMTNFAAGSTTTE
mmetsp:Transcript_26913/g.30964  ORF Transcript_26913/g.30964 Transcript_26913/m.30964 type:complete len:275 (-) Transcript_26913:97-921(-)